jgi:hypothetical protein
MLKEVVHIITTELYEVKAGQRVPLKMLNTASDTVQTSSSIFLNDFAIFNRLL